MNEAVVRLANVKSIDTKFDLGNDITETTYNNAILETQAALEEYNSTLATADEKLNVFNAKEKVLKTIHKRVLKGVELKYGGDSDNYEKAGGTRESERKTTVRKNKPIT